MYVIVPEVSRVVLEECVPLEVRRRFISIVSEGYRLVDEMIRREEILNWILGRQQRGNLINVGVAYAFKEEIDKGSLPFGYKYEYTKRNSHLYFLLEKGNVQILISRTKTPLELPREALFREQRWEYNQGRLDFYGESHDHVYWGPHYLLLTHGYKEPEPYFINLGIPAKNKWIDRIELIEEMQRRQVEISKVPEEKITEEKIIGLKKFVKEVGDLDTE